MTAEEYKAACKMPDVLPRWAIEATKRSLDGSPALVSRLREILDGEPITKPDLHKGGKEVDHFHVQLADDEAQQIQDSLFDLEAGAVGSQGESTPAASHFASLVDIWQEYIEFNEKKT